MRPREDKMVASVSLALLTRRGPDRRDITGVVPEGQDSVSGSFVLPLGIR